MPTYGRLSLICGPMFSGKTTALLKQILWARNGENRQIAVFKPSFDERYARESIVSHDGLKSEALAISKWGSMTEKLIEVKTSVVFFDEIQFMVEPHFEDDLVEIVRGLLKSGIDVCCAGLDMDWQGLPFKNSALIGAMAEDYQKLAAYCSVCGQPATRSFKKTGAGDSIELGGTDLYEPRCTLHWNEDTDQERLL